MVQVKNLQVLTPRLLPYLSHSEFPWLFFALVSGIQNIVCSFCGQRSPLWWKLALFDGQVRDHFFSFYKDKELTLMSVTVLSQIGLASREKDKGQLGWSLRQNKAGQVLHRRKGTCSNTLEIRPKAYDLSIFADIVTQQPVLWRNAAVTPCWLRKELCWSNNFSYEESVSLIYFYNEFEKHC